MVEFSDVSIWTLVLCFTAIFAAMLIANILIKVIKPLRKALIPSPVLGGFILLAFISIYNAITGDNLFKTDSGSLLEIITYHALGLGFVASAMKITNKPKEDGTQKGIFNSSLITVSTYTLQAVVGLIVSMGLFAVVKYVFSSDTTPWPGSGLLLPMGFGQGPGQAFNWGNQYSLYTTDISTFGSFANGSSFGLSVAALGFVSASIGGVIYLNVQKKKGNIKMINRVESSEEVLTLSDYEQENEIATSESIDKGSVQLGLVFFVYAVSFAFIYLVSYLCELSGVAFLVNTVKPLFWGFNFIFGVAFAAIFKVIYKKLNKKGVIKKKYTNNFMLDRISGIGFDVMVTAAIGAIEVEAFMHSEFLAPLLVMCVVGAVITYFYCNHVCKVLYPNYKDEAFLSMYGMLTGAASTGVILLREIDPRFKTPALNNMVFQMVYSIALGAPILLSMGMAAKSWSSLLIWFSVFVLYFILIYTLIRRDEIKAKIKEKKELKATKK